MDDAARMAHWATIDNLEQAVDIFMENSYVIGSDPYYSDLNEALWAMLERARKKREAENKQVLQADPATN